MDKRTREDAIARLQDLAELAESVRNSPHDPERVWHPFARLMDGVVQA
ncbi:MAG: hypothetical protein ACJ76X_12730 [Solirubrobacteraceae bacterium]